MSSSTCFENPPVTNPSCGQGTVEEISGFKTYGYEAPNLRKLADKVAAAGFLVVAPDFLYGDPVDLSDPQFDREAWLKLHSKDKGYEDAKVVVSALKSKGVSSVGVAGFCWGGTVLVKLASSTDINAAVVLHPGTLTVDEINAVKVPIAFLGAEMDRVAPSDFADKISPNCYLY